MIKNLSKQTILVDMNTPHKQAEEQFNRSLKHAFIFSIY